ncbi:hypothetical protein [Lysinibacillus telephonicus]|uniref:hypothetical protein n=1 Tax=Lysinibacillus telephonicus TaxID=1714840 RepID=UPI0037D5889D
METVERIEIEPGYVIEQTTKQLNNGAILMISRDEYGASGELKVGTKSLVFAWGTDSERLFQDLEGMTVAELFAILAGDQLN